MLGGITLGDWVRLLCANRFSIAPSSLPRAVAITAQSVQNSFYGQLERWRYDAAVQAVDVPPPVFVLGHWRSGTTHLHNLLTVDRRFAFPNNYQALFPHTFLTMENLQSRFMQWFLPERRPMDNIQWTMQSPQEDEFALSILTSKSPCMSWNFPKRRDHYDRYLTFRGVSRSEVEQWQAALLQYARRLTYKLKRPLILKSPPHTCRIKLLLEVFPEAKFIHIHRNPLDVFQSTRKMLQINFNFHCLQKPPLKELDDWILQQHQSMYEVYFEERNLVPAGQFHEVAYEDLEREPVGELEQAYQALSLPDFAEVKPAVESYVASLKGYEKNRFTALSAELLDRIADEWRVCFERWNYPLPVPRDRRGARAPAPAEPR